MFRLLFSLPWLLLLPSALPECASAVAEADTAKDVRLCFLKLFRHSGNKCRQRSYVFEFPDFAYEEFFWATFGRTLNYGKIRNVYEQPPVRNRGFSYPFSFQGKLYVRLQEQI